MGLIQRLLVVAVSLSASWVAADNPNIVIIMVDDMGYSDIGCYGGEIDTPNLDRLAKGGVRFSQFYNTSRCCPTRASLLTGLYSHQAGIGCMTANLGRPAYQGYLNDRCVTIVEALRPAGYATLMTGKWHVGSGKGQTPRERGFDRLYGIPEGGGVYFKDTFRFLKRTVVLDDKPAVIPEDWYSTDAFTDYAMRFVKEASQVEKPFFLYVAYIAPHWPLQAKPKDIAKYKDRYLIGWDAIREARYKRQIETGLIKKDWPLSPRNKQSKPWSTVGVKQQRDLAHRMAVYAAQIDCVDQNVGRLVDKLRSLGELDDTLLLFLSDNGCSSEGGVGGFSRGEKDAPIGTGRSFASAGLGWANASDTPFRRFKKDTYEGGIATPLIAHWPKGIPVARRGAIVHSPGHVIDLMPTCLEAASVTYPTKRKGKPTIPLAGRSLQPAFSEEPLERRALYWEHLGNRAVREGKWKLVAANKKPWQLYDLESDRTEQRDVAGEKPEVAKGLAAKWKAWASRVGAEPWPLKKQRRKNSR